MIKECEHLTNEDRLREMGPFNLEKGKLRGIFSMCINTLWEGVKKTEPDSSQSYPVTGQKKNENKLKYRQFNLNIRTKTF